MAMNELADLSEEEFGSKSLGGLCDLGLLRELLKCKWAGGVGDIPAIRVLRLILGACLGHPYFGKCHGGQTVASVPVKALSKYESDKLLISLRMAGVGVFLMMVVVMFSWRFIYNY